MKRFIAMLGLVTILAAPAAKASYSEFALASFSGLWVDAAMTTLLPAGAFFQIWWAPSGNAGMYHDGTTGPGAGTIDPATASIRSGAAGGGLYVLQSGFTPIAGGFGGGLSNQFDDGDVGGAGGSFAIFPGGEAWMYVYEDATPDPGDIYVRGKVITGGLNDTDPLGAAALPQNLDASAGEPEAGKFENSPHVVTPEPGTMALFALGLITVVASRRRRS